MPDSTIRPVSSEKDHNDENALDGVRVLDLSTAIAGPTVATLLADFGAEVIKVEQPGTGDYMRGFAEQPEPGSRSLFWAQEARNRKSVTIDLRRAEGQQLAHRLVETCDIVVINYRPSTLQAWHLTPEELQATNPRAVIVMITGYGLTGPYRDRGAFDRVASAFSGLTYVTGYPDSPPVRSGYSVIDYMTGYLAAFAAITALYHRDLHEGPGQVIDLALYEAAFRASENALVEYSAKRKIRERSGNGTPHIVPAGDFDTSDGRRITLHAGTTSLFRRLAMTMGRPDLLEDSRFANLGGRAKNREALYREIADWVGRHDAETACRLLSDADIPTSPQMSIADIAENEHYLARETIVRLEDEDHGSILMAGPMPKMSATPGKIRTLGPRLGEHTRTILTGDLGLTDDECEALERDGVV